MFLKNIELKNFRCYEDLNIDFRDKTSVIVGANGAGKTSVLEGISIALGTLFTTLDGPVGRSINRKDARLKAYEMGGSSDVQSQFPVEISACASIEGEDVIWKRSLNSSTGSTTVKDAKELIDIAKGMQERLRNGDQTLKLPLIAYYGTGRLWDYHREKKTDTFEVNTRTNGYVDCLDGTANVKLMMNWLKKKTIQEYQRQKQQIETHSEINTVYKAIEECYAQITGYKDVRILYNLDTNELDVYYTNEQGLKMNIPLTQLSDGYKSTISLIADIAYRMSILNPQLSKDILLQTEGVVLIDEIDLHLHPSWQQRVLSDLNKIFPKLQFIVTTHAPAVINTVKSDSLIVLDNYVAREPIGEIYGKDANTIIRGIMGANERPKPVQDMFAQFYDALSEGNINHAEDAIKKLESLIGKDDSELAGCRIKLKLKQHQGV